MQGCRLRTAAGHESFDVSFKTDAARVRLQINLLRPASAQSIIESVSDSINFSLRATRRRFRDQAEPTRIASSMHVEKRDAITLAKRAAFNVEKTSANLAQTSNGNMPRNEWIRNTLQAALLKIKVGAADFRKLDFEQSRISFEVRSWNVAQLNRRAWLRDDSNKRHGGEVKGKSEKGEVS